MATHTALPALEVPPLVNGDRMTRAEFERRWESMPDLKKAELIEGVVSIMPALSIQHGSPHFDLIIGLGWYRTLTPGIMGADNTSIRFDDENMPQPDVLLRLRESHGGRSRIDGDGFLDTGPELIAETSAAFDLGVKKEVYRRFGVPEYIVWSVEMPAIDWFALRDGQYVPLSPGPDGIVRSEVFPGLWLDPAALVNGDAARQLAVAQLGLGSPEHAAFVQQLRRRAEA